jgi:hypothetical protein
MAKDVIEKA